MFRVIVRCQPLDTWITPGPLPSSPGIQGDQRKGGKIGQDIPDTGAGGLEGIRRQEREDGKYFPQLPNRPEEKRRFSFSGQTFGYEVTIHGIEVDKKDSETEERLP